MGSITAISYFLYETTYAVNPFILNRNYEEESEIGGKQSPIYSFMYALRSSEARRQYPKRLKMLFDFLGLPGSLEGQAKGLLEKARQNAQWAQDSIMTFLEFYK